MKRLIIKDRKKFNRFLVMGFIFLTIALYLMITLVFSNKVIGVSDNRNFTVIHGDTVWNIASGIKSDKDIREVVHDIYTINGMSSGETIYPGQVLRIPVYE